MKLSVTEGLLVSRTLNNGTKRGDLFVVVVVFYGNTVLLTGEDRIV